MVHGKQVGRDQLRSETGTPGERREQTCCPSQHTPQPNRRPTMSRIVPRNHSDVHAARRSGWEWTLLDDVVTAYDRG